ncbi:ABC transporter substrate-binding protein [Jidongwangia harbinensis]|uniref:ABC transporter substrate-binding protein n=1 Tax=Jidongwangia harbinensis TaxID=2878561 RepID=UPI001CD92012|nr:ABC transporter substrate-binding protein [Jidongwangia harbinensis]MCA2212042.1 ABC transporter substrate-binding protein [Jidongwangia harbinensis]
MKQLLAATTLTALILGGTTGCFAEPAPADGGDQRRLRVGLAFAPNARMSPFTDDASLVTQLGVTETLVNLDPDGTVTPALAERWTVTNPSTVRLTLRSGVTFHDGTALTAQHAAAALQHATRARPVPKALAQIRLTATATDDRTVELRTAAPDPVLLHRLATPQLAILAPRAYQSDPAGPDPIGAGTGPFRLTAVRGTSGATLQRFDAYWGGAARVAGVDVRFLPDGAARAGALRAGEVDVINAVPVAQLPHLGDHRLVEVPLPRTVGLHLNSTAGRPFADPRLRAAVRAAADPAAIVASVYEGRVDVGAGLFGPASAWAASGRTGRPATAAAVPAGTRITLATYTDRPELPEAASALTAALTGRGFAVRTVVREYTALEPDLLAGRFDAVLLTRSYLLDTGDPIAFLASDFGCAGSYNLARFCDRAFDTRVTRAGELTEPAARQNAALQLEADLIGRAVVVPLAHERARIGTTTDVTDVARDPYERTLVTARTALR